MLAPAAALERRIRTALDEQLGKVLPPDPSRGQDPYFERAVLGARALEVYDVLMRGDLPGGAPVLDVGCGFGSFVLLSAQLGLPALGIEPGASEFQLSRQRAATMDLDGDAVFSLGTGEELPYANDSMAAVVLHDVLEHARDWRAVLHESVRVLMPRGLLYVKSPNYAGVRFTEPHYRVAWLPMLPRTAARRYLSARGRDSSYFDHHIHYLRRGPVLDELRGLQMQLAYPRVSKLERTEAINRPWVRKAVKAAVRSGAGSRGLRFLAENPLQASVEVTARKPSASG